MSRNLIFVKPFSCIGSELPTYICSKPWVIKKLSRIARNRQKWLTNHQTFRRPRNSVPWRHRFQREATSLEIHNWLHSSTISSYLRITAVVTVILHILKIIRAKCGTCWIDISFLILPILPASHTPLVCTPPRLQAISDLPSLSSNQPSGFHIGIPYCTKKGILRVFTIRIKTKDTKICCFRGQAVIMTNFVRFRSPAYVGIVGGSYWRRVNIIRVSELS